MTDPTSASTKAFTFYITPAQTCSYLPQREASSLMIDPRIRLNTHTYSILINYGFRRSGDYVYRPHCRSCDACIPVRMPVTQFQPRRCQKRIWQRNQDITVRRVTLAYHEEHFQLYQRYIGARHPGGGMDYAHPEHYMELIGSSAIDTALYEFRLLDRLLAVAVVDHLAQSLSAVYTFFDPDQHARSLGVYVILWQIHEAQRLGMPWLYLGYWIKECRKMSYKNQFQPLQMYRDGKWRVMTEA